MKRSIIIFALGLVTLWSTEACATEMIKVGTIHRPPFVFIDEHEGNISYSGFTIDLLKEIENRASLSMDYVKHVQFASMLDSVTNGDVDMAAANISITSNREEVMDFTHPIYDSGLQILVRKGDGVSLWKVLWESEILKFLGFAVGVLLIIAHMLWFFENGVKDRRHDYFRDDYFGGVWDAFWWAFIIMTMGGFENEVPHRKISRILAMFWIIVSLFFISTLTAKITTALTIGTLTSNIESYKDLYNKKLGIAVGTTMEIFAQNEGLSYIRYDDFALALEALEVGEVDAVIGDAPIVQYYATHEGSATVMLVGEIFATDKIAISLPQKSQYYELINYTLLTIQEDGTYEKIYKKWFGN